MWTSLADYYIRRGLIEKARDVYEEGLTTVTTVRDFSLIFDTLTQVQLPQHHCMCIKVCTLRPLHQLVLAFQHDLRSSRGKP